VTSAAQPQHNVPEPQTVARFCRECGTARTPSASFCRGCGSRLAEAVVASPVLTLVPESEATPQVQPAHVAQQMGATTTSQQVEAEVSKWQFGYLIAGVVCLVLAVTLPFVEGVPPKVAIPLVLIGLRLLGSSHSG